MVSMVANEGPEVPRADLLKNRFGLTPSQARLVIHLTAGHSLRSSAKALGVKYETVRSYLKPVFQKTGTHRQAELVLTVFSAMTDDPKAPALPASPPRNGSRA
jgi:DNA-binding CsgD family transcriptional regulator